MTQRQTRKTKKHASGQSSTQGLMTLGTAAHQAVKTIAALSLAALCERLCKLSLSPIYGALPSEVDVILHTTIFTASVLTVLGEAAEKNLKDCQKLTPFLGYQAPIMLPIVAQLSSGLGPYWGPLTAYASTSFPILFTLLAGNVLLYRRAIFQTVRIPAWLENNTLLNGGVRRASVIVLTYVFLLLLRAFEKAAILISSSLITDSIGGILSSRYGTQAFLAALWAFLAPFKWAAALGVLPLLQVFIFSPHIPAMHNCAIANATLQTAGWSLVARQESVTGYISVLDNVRDGFRVMRCDHSLLGGEWRNKPEGHPAKVNDPIYSIFVMLEAVRLVEPRAGTKSTLVDENALVM